MMTHIGKSAALFVLLFVSACAIPKPPLPYDAHNPLKRVAVLPLRNDTNDVEGPEVLRKKMVKALEDRSYVVKDLKETDQILRDRMGITLGGQLELTTSQKLGEELGVEGVLYGTLIDFDESTTGVINVKKVRGKFKLVNAMTGQAMWARGLGVRSEMRMGGNYGSAAAVLSRVADARDKEAPWVTIESTSTGSDKLGTSLAVGLGTKLLSKAVGKHLDHESAELAWRITDNLPWGPGSGAVAVAVAPAPAPTPAFAMPEIKTPEPPSFGYMEWEGKRDFTAVVFSTTVSETYSMEMPLAIAKNRMRLEMDMSKMMKDDPQSPVSRMIMLDRGDKNKSYTLYPNAKRFMVHAGEEAAEEKPRVDKTRMGSETIGKYKTDKFRVKITYKDGTVEEGLIWNAGELEGMTIKSEVENKDYRITTELRNIVLKTPQASLFEIPAGYSEARGFMDLMMKDTSRK
jgi:hypothetical protein